MKNFATALCLTGLAAAADQLTVGEYVEKTQDVDSLGYQWVRRDGGIKVDDDEYIGLKYITERREDNPRDTKQTIHLS